MRRPTILLLLLVTLFPAFSLAETPIRQTPQSKKPAAVIQYVEKAVALIQEQGEAAYPVLTDPAGPWVEDDWYIYVNNFQGVVVAHLNKMLEGQSLLGVRDVKGNAFYARLQRIGQSKAGAGWADFWWPRAGSTTAERKLAYIMRVPGRELWVGTGIYGMAEDDVAWVLANQDFEPRTENN